MENKKEYESKERTYTHGCVRVHISGTELSSWFIAVAVAVAVAVAAAAAAAAAVAVAAAIAHGWSCCLASSVAVFAGVAVFQGRSVVLFSCCCCCSAVVVWRAGFSLLRCYRTCDVRDGALSFLRCRCCCCCRCLHCCWW